MPTRAKFTCQEVRQYVNGGVLVYDSKLSAVIGDTPENKEFWKWTPSGSIVLSTVKADHFIPGRNYYVDFTETE
jgi:hypothetical protein